MKVGSSSIASASARMKPPIKVMVVDDSAVVRGIYTRIIEASSDIKVEASASDGLMAINNLKRHKIDVIILDIEMPNMDGMTALPKLLEAQPHAKIIMASSLTLRNAEISLRAIEMGAVDYIPKPSSRQEMTAGSDFQEELVGKIRAWGDGARKVRLKDNPDELVALQKAENAEEGTVAVSPRLSAVTPLVFRSKTMDKPDAVAIGSSTGGPQALFKVLQGLKGIQQPVFITQHMPASFTTILAEHITKLDSIRCVEAEDGMVVQSGQAYLAPGNYHMTIVVEGGQKIIRLNQDLPENFCRPAVDPMLRSLAKAYNGKVLLTILTGMGSDGAKGADVLVKAGGAVLAQDQATSVVWGMPGAVAKAGLCHAVLPLEQIAAQMMQIAQKGIL